MDGGILEKIDEKKTFLRHIFPNTEEGNAEIFNAIQYSILAIIPIVFLNKLIHRFVPDPDIEKGSLEIAVEIVLQLVVLIVGMIFIHRIITYIPTYSGFKYENMIIVNVIIAFMIIVFSLQTKIGIKANILYERLVELWEGEKPNKNDKYKKKTVNVTNPLPNPHTPSRADNDWDTPPQGHPLMMANTNAHSPPIIEQLMDPQPANFSGSPFGTSF